MTPFRWGHEHLSLTIGPDADGRVGLLQVDSGAGPLDDADLDHRTALPLVELTTPEAGSDWSGGRLTESTIGARLTYVSHESSLADGLHRLTVQLTDELSGLDVDWCAESFDAVAAFRTWTEVRNAGTSVRTVLGVVPLVMAVDTDVEEWQLAWATNDWLGEYRWQVAGLRPTLLPDLARPVHGHDLRSCFEISARGSWSTGQFLPMGLLRETDSGRTFAWEVEATSPWTWQVGEREHGFYLAAAGPDDAHHQGGVALAPGEAMTSPAVSLAIGLAGWSSALAALTTHRRSSRVDHPAFSAPPVVFNDYMNALMGDPSETVLAPVIDAAAAVGAEVFCIDAGWYADDDGWWDSVGQWVPSARRFPSGLGKTVDRIRDAGMTPGLWLEPEVVGVNSPVAEQLPPEAFFQRGGTRVVEHQRYHLDLSHPAAVRHLDDVVDRLVLDFGIGHFKLDYNISVPQGTDTRGRSPGQGLLDHGRAVARWHRSLVERYPSLVLENCSSGGMRADAALLRSVQLQSITDQQDVLRSLPIAAAAATAMTPELAGIWCYPDRTWSEDLIRAALAAVMIGRFHLSGRLDLLAPHQLKQVAAGVDAYRASRGDLLDAHPIWPLGLPEWEASWIGAGYVRPGATRVVVWRRDGRDPTSTVDVRLPWVGGDATVSYPLGIGDGDVDWSPEAGVMTVRLPSFPSVAVVDLRD